MTQHNLGISAAASACPSVPSSLGAKPSLTFFLLCSAAHSDLYDEEAHDALEMRDWWWTPDAHASQALSFRFYQQMAVSVCCLDVSVQAPQACCTGALAVSCMINDYESLSHCPLNPFSCHDPSQPYGVPLFNGAYGDGTDALPYPVSRCTACCCILRWLCTLTSRRAAALVLKSPSLVMYGMQVTDLAADTCYRLRFVCGNTEWPGKSVYP